VTEPAFTGSCALVTGASSGIGRALAVELARRKARLALVGRRGEALAETRDLCLAAGAARADAWTFDLRNLPAIDGLVSEVGQRLGAPVGLAIHAAGSVLIARVEDYPIDRAQELIDVNLMAGFALARALVPRMREAGGGTIGFIASGTAYRAVPFQWAYAASKAGIERLAEALRLELAGSPVRVRVVSPGPVDTAMNSDPPTVGDAPMLSAAKAPPVPQAIAPAILAGFAGRRPRVELNRRVTITRWLSAFGAEPLDFLLRRTLRPSSSKLR
jgi:NAD(P)-dependent dehydrogenase (short-subunit alcohol dehydrogenase family)